VSYFLIANWIDYLIFKLALRTAGFTVQDIAHSMSLPPGAPFSTGAIIMLAVVRPVVSTLIIFGGGAVVIASLGLQSWAAFAAFAYYFLLTQRCCLVGRRYSLNVAGWAMVITIIAVIVIYYAKPWRTPESTGLFAQTREELHEVYLPSKYPVLLSHIEEHGALDVEWISRTGASRYMHIWLGPGNSVILTTAIPMGDTLTATDDTVLVTVTMTDEGADGTLDHVLFSYPDGTTDVPDVEENEGLRLFWDQCLSVAFALGDPFR
jgi:hypothetical protein